MDAVEAWEHKSEWRVAKMQCSNTAAVSPGLPAALQGSWGHITQPNAHLLEPKVIYASRTTCRRWDKTKPSTEQEARPNPKCCSVLGAAPAAAAASADSLMRVAGRVCMLLHICMYGIVIGHLYSHMQLKNTGLSLDRCAPSLVWPPLATGWMVLGGCLLLH